MEQKREKPAGSGRKAGTPNKLTKELRERIGEMLDGQFDKVETELQALKGEKFLKFFIEFLPYRVAKLAAVEENSPFRQMTPEQIQKAYEMLKSQANQNRDNNLRAVS